MEKKVITIAARILKLPVSELTAASSPDTVHQWDSLKHMQLVLAIEEAFNLQFTDDEIVSIKSLQNVIALLENKSGAGHV